MAGEHLDLTSDYPFFPAGNRGGSRPFVGVRFACCDVYLRIYINREQTAYRGACPRCARRIELKIGPGGTDARFFTVS